MKRERERENVRVGKHVFEFIKKMSAKEHTHTQVIQA